MGGIGVNETQVLAALDELIERVAPSDFSALVVALSARLCALALNAAAKSQPRAPPKSPSVICRLKRPQRDWRLDGLSLQEHRALPFRTADWEAAALLLTRPRTLEPNPDWRGVTGLDI